MISADFIIMFRYQCSSIIVRMIFCISPGLSLILHVAPPLYSISLFSSTYFPAIVISSSAFNCGFRSQKGSSAKLSVMVFSRSGSKSRLNSRVLSSLSISTDCLVNASAGFAFQGIWCMEK